MRSALIILLVPVGFHLSGSAALRNEQPTDAEYVVRWDPRYLAVCLRQGYDFATNILPGDQPIFFPFQSIGTMFLARRPHDFPPEMTNAKVQSLMEACIMRRLVRNSRGFASSPKSRNEASGVIGRLSMCA